MRRLSVWLIAIIQTICALFFVSDVLLTVLGVEAAGKGVNAKMEHCASLTGGLPRVLHGNRHLSVA